MEDLNCIHYAVSSNFLRSDISTFTDIPCLLPLFHALIYLTGWGTFFSRKKFFFVITLCITLSWNNKSFRSQIASTVVKAFACQADGLGFNYPSGYKVGHPGHSKYVLVGQYEPLLKVPFLGP